MFSKDNHSIEIKTYTKEDFFKAIFFFQSATYNQKVDYMNKHWGKIISTTTIQYPEGCSVTVGFDDSNKYFFEFDCKKISFEEISENLPMYAESIMSLSKDEIMEKHPEFKNLEIEEFENITNSVEENVEENTAQIDNAYLNYYNGIKFNK